MVDSSKIFIKNLKSLIEIEKMSITDLSKKLGMDRSSTGRIVSGETWPKAKIIDKLCLIFRVRPDFFFKEEGQDASTIPPEMALEVLKRAVEENSKKS